MLFFLSCLIKVCNSVSMPDYYTQTTSMHTSKSVPAWNIDVENFEAVLFPRNNPEKIRIIFPYIDKTLKEYEIRPAHDLYSKVTHQKYPGQLFHFIGNEVGNTSNIIGFVYCFKYIKVYFVGHSQTLESDGPSNKISIVDYEADNSFTTSKKIVHELNESLFERQTADEFHRTIQEGNHPLSLDTTLNVRMSEIKFIKYLLFPSIEYVQHQISGRGLGAFTLTHPELKKYVFSQLAASLSFVNLIYHAQLSVHLEMVFDLDMILIEKTQTNYNKYLIAGTTTPDNSNNLYSYAMKFFKPSEVDAGSIAHAYKDSKGVSSAACMRPYSNTIMESTTFDKMITFGLFESTLAHEIGHCLGTRHSFKYQSNGVEEATEVGSGVSIMGYPGRTKRNDVQNGQSLFFT